MHVFAVIVWLGGMMFQSAVVVPIAQHEGGIVKGFLNAVNHRFVGFIWMSVWTLAVTGIIMMLLNPNFIWLKFDNRWSILMASKIVIFILMVFYGFGYARMLEYLSRPSSNGGYNELAELYKHRIEQFRRMSIMLGIAALLLAAAL